MERIDLRPLYRIFWFICVPLLLAWFALKVFTPKEALVAPQGIIEKVLWFIKDQWLPSLIIFFTLFESIIYSYRHVLPGGALLATGGRVDIPKSVRREFDLAWQLLDETERIQRRNRAQIDKELSLEEREELQELLAALREQLQRKPFQEEEFRDALEQASRRVNELLTPWQKGEVREYVESIGLAILVALLLRALVIEAFKIPSGSMLPTLQLQDHIFVNKLVYGPTIPFTNIRLFNRLPPARGDVMVFEFPDPNPNNERSDYIKRVIALSGDTLEAENGHPIINGWRVPNCPVGHYEFREAADGPLRRSELFVEYLGEYSYLTIYEDDRSEGRQGPFKVKSGETWVMGDNRNNSADSRAWNNGRGGGVPDANIKGRAMFVWLSFSLDGKNTLDRVGHSVLGNPRLPAGAPPHLVAAIEKCVNERPSIDQTTPPPPKP